jgi:uncharacterized protein
MNLGFDIDGVIANFSEILMQTVKKTFGVTLNPKDIYCFNLNVVLGITKVEEDQLIADALYQELPLYPNAKETLEQLQREGHNIYLLTGRWSHLRETTQNWLKEKGVPYNELHHLKIGRKYEANVDGLDLVVEDSLEEAIEWTQRVKNVLVYDQPWNQSLNIRNLMKRVYNWNDIYQEIQRLNGLMINPLKDSNKFLTSKKDM